MDLKHFADLVHLARQVAKLFEQHPSQQQRPMLPQVRGEWLLGARDDDQGEPRFLMELFHFDLSPESGYDHSSFQCHPIRSCSITPASANQPMCQRIDWADGTQSLIWFPLATMNAFSTIEYAHGAPQRVGYCWRRGSLEELEILQERATAFASSPPVVDYPKLPDLPP